MLPTHRLSSNSSGAGPSFHLPKRFLSISWITLGCLVFALIWLGGRRLANSWSVGFEYLPTDPHPLAPAHIARPSNPHPRPTKEEQDVWEPRKNEVKNAFKHAWSGYKTIAFPNDELLSLSGGSSNKFNGWGVTLFDSLSTMWVMGLRDEFTEAVDSIRDHQFHATKADHFPPFFETTIRYLGGSLSAYALSGDPTLLRHADRIGQILLPAFNDTKSGLPYPSVNVETGEIPYPGGVSFAEAASCQLEFKFLAKLTGNREYYDKAEHVMDLLYRANETDGLFHLVWSLDDGAPSGDHFTSGPPADSGYEYLLKQWVQSGDPKARQQYIKSATGIINKLIYQTPIRGLLYAAEISHGKPDHRFQHLTCYLPGVLALGAFLLPDTELSPKDKEIHRWAAHGLAYTCAISFLDQKSGLGSEEMRMSAGRRWMSVVDQWELEGRHRGDLPPGMGVPGPETDPSKRDYYTVGNVWLLRPEGIESIFIMWKTTGDIKWRERGYAIFQAIEQHARTEYGYASIRDIDKETVTQLDNMPSWFLSETLKYLYLLFDDSNSVALDRWVFSTEAHPLPIFSWSKKEREDFGIVL